MLLATIVADFMTSNSVVLALGITSDSHVSDSGTDVTVPSTAVGCFQLTGATSVAFQHWGSRTGASGYGLGDNTNIGSGETHVDGYVQFVKED